MDDDPIAPWRPAHHEPRHRARRQGLSETQCRILALVAEGRTDREIAAALGYSYKTVKNYLLDAYKRMDAHGRAHAVALALQQGLIAGGTGDGRR